MAALSGELPEKSSEGGPSGDPWGGNLDSPVFKELFVLNEYDDIAAGGGSHARLCRDALLP